MRELPVFADPNNLVPAKESEAVLPDVVAHGYLQRVYRGRIEADHWRLKAAIEALPFERPKLAVIAQIGGDDFAERLTRAIERSAIARSGKVINGSAQPVIDHRPTALVRRA
jgi:hypothetical protein